jgi:hypothetical protein
VGEQPTLEGKMSSKDMTSIAVMVLAVVIAIFVADWLKDQKFLKKA